MDQMDFGSFLKKNQAYKSICDRFSEPFNRLFVTALNYFHQVELHTMQQQTGPFDSEELESAKEILSECLGYILPHVEATYADEVHEALAEFKQQHKNDKPVHELSEFRGLLESFLEFLEKKINPPPPPQEQQAWGFAWFLEKRFSGLAQAIGNDSRLTNEDRNQLSFFILVLSRDSVDQGIDLTNRGVFGPEGIQKTVMFKYIEALRGAYAVYMGELPLARGPSIER
jgi:hypothetical protein